MSSIDDRAQLYVKALGLHSYHAATSNWQRRVRAVMAVADAEMAELRAEVERLAGRVDALCSESEAFRAGLAKDSRVRAAEAQVARVEALADEYDRVIPDSGAAQSIRDALQGRA